MSGTDEQRLKQELAAARGDYARRPGEVLACLQRLADHYLAAQGHEDAWPLLQEAVHLQVRTSGATSTVTETVDHLYKYCSQIRRSASRSQLFRKLLSALQGPSSEWAVSLAVLLNELAEAIYSQQQFVTAMQCCRRALTLLGGDPRAESPEMFRTRNNLACLHVAQNQFPLALRLFALNLQSVQRQVEPDASLLAVQYGNVAEMYRRQGRTSDAESVLLQAVERVVDDLPVEHPHHTHLLNLLAGVRGDQGKYRSQRSLYRRILSIRERTLPPNHFLTIETTRNLGEASLRCEDYAESERLLTKALNYFDSLDAPHPLQSALAAFQLGQLYLVTNRLATAERMFHRALSCQDLRSARLEPFLAQAYNGLGVLHRARGQIDDADRQHLEALRLQEQALGDKHVDIAETLILLGDVACVRHSPFDAAPLYQRAYDIRVAKLGKLHAQSAEACHRLGKVCLQMGEPLRAAGLCSDAWQVVRALSEPHPALLIEIWKTLASAYTAMNQLDTASRLLQAAVKLKERLAGPKNPDIASGLVQLADVEAAAGRFSAAEGLLQRGWTLIRESNGQSTAELSDIVERFARLHLVRGNLGAAQTWMEQALAMRERKFGRTSPEVAELLDEFAQLLRSDTQPEAAKVMEQRAESIRDATQHVLCELF